MAFQGRVTLPAAASERGYRERLEELLREHGLDGVHFTGQAFAQPGPLFSLASRLRVSLNPSGGLGIVGAEAMASGLVCKQLRCGAAELFSDQKSGLRFQAGNAQGLAEHLLLCRNPAKLCQLA